MGERETKSAGQSAMPYGRRSQPLEDQSGCRVTAEYDGGPNAAAMKAPMTVLSFEDPTPIEGMRDIPSEVPINLVYGGIPFAVMMATPHDLDDFALGFSLTEGVIQHHEDVRRIRIDPEGSGIRLSIELAPGRLHEHLARKRALSGRTGCGLCGIDDFNSLPQAKASKGAAPAVSLPAVRAALLGLEQEQTLNELTRAVHAAAWSDLDGTVRIVREDVGRHNALDKLIGAIGRAGFEPGSGFVLVTSRCSFELVEKVAAAGVRTLIAISAPTSLALERARLLDITLIGIARRDAVVVFHGGERIGRDT